MGSIATPLPFGPLLALQFAICYVNLAIPSTAARVAMNVRFFQRFGVKPTEAMAAGVIDSVSGFIVQIALFLLLFTTSDLDFGISLDTSELSGLATIALIVLARRRCRVAIVLLVAPGARAGVRHRPPGGRLAARAALADEGAAAVRRQRRVAGAVRRRHGGLRAGLRHVEVPLGELVLINTVVSLFAGLLPIPGGIGVSEAGLTLGLTAAGLSSETAFAVAITYRFASFYLPPIWG